MIAVQFLTVADLANRLQKPAEWVRRNARTGNIPAIKIGQHWRFHPDHIEAWEQRRTNHHLDPLQMTELSAKRQGLKNQ